jgi:hypothetical protein
MSDTTAVAPHLNSIVELLEADNPTVLDSLRKRYPAQENLLRKGLIIGAADQRVGSDALYCDLSREGLGAAERQLAVLLQVLAVRLARAKKLRLFAALVASLASAGVLTAVFADARLAARVAAGVAFIASVGTLVAQYLETPLGGDKATTTDNLRDLIALESRLRDSKVRLAEAEQAHTQATPGRRTAQSCRDLIVAVNDVAAQIRRIQLFAGTA